MSGSDKSWVKSNSDLRTRLASKVPVSENRDNLADEPWSEDATHAKAGQQFGLGDIDDQIRSFFAHRPRQIPIAHRRDK